MKKYFLLFLAFAGTFFVSGCGMPAPVPSTPTFMPTESISTKPAAPPAIFTPVCISAQPAQADIDRALMFTGVTFSAAEWERSYTVSENRVSVSWLNNSQGTLAYAEALIFPCGYEESDINNYFNDENWKTIFQSYESYMLTAPMCKTDSGLRLYEFKAVSQGSDYDVRFWAQNDTANRVITLMFVTPAGNETMMNDFASRLFPQLSTCSK
jgi:hypothetical protein